MAVSSISLFPDTNLFIQCQDLRSLNWGALGDFDQIELIVARPVQKEIDRQKGGANSRLSRRARSAASLFGEIINANLEPIVVREASPRVTLRLGNHLKPDPSLDLDYSDPDDTLVGITHGCAKANPTQHVAVLTYDTGVQASAVATHTRHFRIPDAWLLRPEETKAEKDLRSAQAEITRLKASEPIITIDCIDEAGDPIKEIQLDFGHIKPLDADEIEEFIRMAKRSFPLKDFSKKPVVSPHVSSLVQNIHLLGGMPPSQTQIAEYLAAYRVWEDELRTALKDIHVIHARIRSRPVIGFRGQNQGTRPADNVLVEIKANGRFGVCRHRTDNSERVEAEKEDALPAPPAPPVGGFLGRMIGMHDLIAGTGRRSGFDITPLLSGSRKDDPDVFYYKGDCDVPAVRLSREAERWRHGIDPKDFLAELQPFNYELTSGSVELSVHASNMSDRVKLVVPITIRIVESDTFARTAALLQGLKPVPVD